MQLGGNFKERRKNMMKREIMSIKIYKKISGQH